MASNTRKITNVTPADFALLLDFAGMHDDTGIVSALNDGGDATISEIYANELFSRAFKTLPKERDIDVTSFGLSRKEWDFMQYFFENFMGMPKEWLFGRLVGYLKMQDEEQRILDGELQKMYSGFSKFYHGLGDTKVIILNSLAPKMAHEFVDTFNEGENKLKAQAYLDKHGSYNVGLLAHLAKFWKVNNIQQMKEAIAMPPKTYTPKILRTDNSTKIVKALVHEIAMDGRIDSLEKKLARDFLHERFSGFEELDQSCVTAMYSDIKRKDLLANLAIIGKLDGVNIPQARGLTEEIYEIGEKAKKTKELLAKFDGEIDYENVHMAAYLLSVAIGFRGSNCAMMLGEYGASESDLESLNLRDVPELVMANNDIDYWKKCDVPEISQLVSSNPGRF